MAKTTKEIVATIKRVVRNNAKRVIEIHTCAFDCLEHAEEHGDATLMDRLVKELEATGDSLTAQALKIWAQAFSPIMWNGDNQVKMYPKDHKMIANREKYFDLEQADAKPFFSYVKAKDPEPLDFEKLLKMAKRLVTTIDSNEKKGRIKDGENVQAMRTFAARIASVADTEYQKLQSNNSVVPMRAEG